MHDLGLRFEIVRNAVVNYGALFHQKNARTQLECRFDILLDQKDRHAGLINAVDLAPDLLDQPRHDALVRLIQDDQLGAHHKTARNREHLLLAA